jgi:hypothetical protein
MTATTKKPEVVDWGTIDDITEGRRGAELPEGAITREMVEDRYGISSSAANERMRKLVSSGRFERFTFNTGASRANYLLPKAAI